MTIETATVLAAVIGAIGMLAAALIPYLVHRTRTPPGSPPPASPATPVDAVNSPAANLVNPRPRASGSLLTFTVREGNTLFVQDFDLTIGLNDIGDLGLRASVTLPGQETRTIGWYAGSTVWFPFDGRNYILTCNAIDARRRRVTFQVYEVAQ